MTNELMSFLGSPLCKESLKNDCFNQAEYLSSKAAYPLENAIHEHS